MVATSRANQLRYRHIDISTYMFMWLLSGTMFCIDVIPENKTITARLTAVNMRAGAPTVVVK